jgi:hypothetical protein
MREVSLQKLTIDVVRQCSSAISRASLEGVASSIDFVQA